LSKILTVKQFRNLGKNWLSTA